MKIGTKVQEIATGRTGVIAGESKMVSWDWKVAVKWDDGEEAVELEHELKAVASPIEPKAINFERDAKFAGWTALARNSQRSDNVSLVTARCPFNGDEIVLVFEGGRFSYPESFQVRGGKTKKVRNVSEAKRILAGLA